MCLYCNMCFDLLPEISIRRHLIHRLIPPRLSRAGSIPACPPSSALTSVILRPRKGIGRGGGGEGDGGGGEGEGGEADGEGGGGEGEGGGGEGGGPTGEGRVEVTGKVTVRRCTGLQERRAGTYSPEDDGGATALPIERVRMSRRTG